MGLLATKRLEDLAEAPEGGAALHRTLGAGSLVALGIGAIIGGGLFSLTGIAAAENAGPAIVLSFLVAAVGCAFAGMCYSEFAAMIPVAGSAYTYAYATMGELIAWIIGWDLVLEYAVGAATIAVAWSQYVVSLLQDFGIVLPSSLVLGPWDKVTLANGGPAVGVVNLPAILIVAVLSLLLIRGMRHSATVNTLIVIVKVAIVVVFVALGAFYITPANYVPFIPANTGQFGQYGLSGILRGAGVIFFAYIGFDAVSTAAQEAREPQRAMPIGIIGSLAICTILYIAFAFVLTGMVNYHQLDTRASAAVAIDITPFGWLRLLVKLGIIFGLTSVILVTLLGQSRVFYSMARDRLLPPIFSDVHPRYLTPWRSNLVFLVFVGAMAGLVPLSKLGHMTSIGTLLAFVIVCAGVMILRWTRPELPRPYRTPWVPVVPVLGILTCLLMMVSLEIETWYRLGIWLAVGLVIYFGYSRRQAARLAPDRK
jgi:basic amino acid/polyamine antiporter, APA family